MSQHLVYFRQFINQMVVLDQKLFLQLVSIPQRENATSDFPNS